MELLDIVDENDTLTGEKNDREFIHDNNLYHRLSAIGKIRTFLTKWEY